VVITGGEPLLQQRRLVPLLEGLRDRGWAVEIETNGTIGPGPEVAARVSAFNVSPKLANSGIAEDRRIRPAALRALAATGRAVFKFVATGPTDLDEIAALAEAHALAPIWVMPEGTDATTVAARLATLADEVVARGWNLTPRLQILAWGDQRGR
jgi:7-carboxy-7-deazaguanine synthase